MSGNRKEQYANSFKNMNMLVAWLHEQHTVEILKETHYGRD